MKMPLLRLKNLLSVSALCATGLISATSVYANDQHHEDENSDRPITVAVIGDWPYNKLLLDNAHLLIDSINADVNVSRLIHVGDIHAGSMPCTSVDILPPIPQSNPGDNKKSISNFSISINQLSTRRATTSGPTAKNPSNAKVASVRSQFFAKPGLTQGKEAQVLSQAQHFDSAYPTDAQFVENVMWKQGNRHSAPFLQILGFII